jgi:protein-tyrosine phosphatase
MAAVAWRIWAHRQSTRIYRPGACATAFSWIGDERIAIGNMPTGESLKALAEQGVTHIVNCRARPQTWISQDLYAERATFGEARVIHAAMYDFGRLQPAALWTKAALFAAAALEDPDVRVLIHCHGGRRRSAMVAYAVLRLRGHDPEEAARLILAHRREAVLVPNYCASVEQWLAQRS